MRRDLSGLELVALMIDGVHLPEHVVPAAVGIDSAGAKHPLGLREGATENAAACKELLADLIERGLDPDRAILVVIDGAKALHKALFAVFGERVLPSAVMRIRSATSPTPCHNGCGLRCTAR